MRATRAMLSIGLLLATTSLLIFKIPHLRLALAMASGQIDGRQIPVEDFSPAQFTGKTVTVRCGNLLFEVPDDARVEPQPGADASSLWVWSGGILYHVFPPIEETAIEQDFLKEAEWARACENDEVSQRVALYKSNGNQLSFWLSFQEAEWLQEKLEIRLAFCSHADRIEVLRGSNLSGFLLFRKIEETPYMEFDYFCGEFPLRGRVFVTLDPSQSGAMDEVRAFLSSLRFQPATLGDQLASASP